MRIFRMKARGALFSDVPLFWKLASIFGLVFVLMAAMSLANDYFYKNDKREMTLNVVGQTNLQVASKIDEYMQDLANMSKLPYTWSRRDNALIESFERFNASNVMDIGLKLRIDDLFYELNSFKASIQSQFLFNVNGYGEYEFYDDSFLSEPYNPVQERWFEKVVNNNGKPVMIGTRQIPHNEQLDGSPVFVYSLARPIVNYQSAETVAVLLINTKLELLAEYCRAMIITSSQRIVIVDPEGKTVYDTESSNIAKPLEGTLAEAAKSPMSVDTRDGFIISKIKLPFTGWTLMNQIPEYELFRDIKRMERVTIIVTGSVILLAVMLLLLLTTQIVKPVKRLMTSMKQMESGKFDARIDLRRRDEIGALARTFDRMAVKIDTLINEVYAEKLAQTELELRMLQYQINPHFLYNTLESIRMMAELNNDEQAATMTESLGKILRYRISPSDDYITVGEEVGLLRDYIMLQLVRFDDLYTIEVEIDESLYPKRILKLLLQPLVENAIYHGLRNKESCGLIRIHGYERDGFLVFEISDNGTGMSEDELRRLETSILDFQTSSGSIGLQNVNKRIKLHYGQEYGLELTSVPGEGTTVTVRIPSVAGGRSDRPNH